MRSVFAETLGSVRSVIGASGRVRTVVFGLLVADLRAGDLVGALLLVVERDFLAAALGSLGLEVLFALADPAPAPARLFFASLAAFRRKRCCAFLISLIKSSFRIECQPVIP